MIKIYCEVCGIPQPLIVEPMQKDELNGEKVWGDLLCGKCFFIIATIDVDEPGIYEFKQTFPLEPHG